MNCPYKRLNLEWVTGKENMKHASKYNLINHDSPLRKKSLAKNRQKINYDQFSIPVIQLNKMGQYITEYPSIQQASKAMNCSPSVIRNVAFHKGYHKTAKGYVWIRKDSYDPKKDYAVHYKQNKHYD